jgi:hypothetical protein
MGIACLLSARFEQRTKAEIFNTTFDLRAQNLTHHLSVGCDEVLFQKKKSLHIHWLDMLSKQLEQKPTTLVQNRLLRPDHVSVACQ